MSVTAKSAYQKFRIKHKTEKRQFFQSPHKVKMTVKLKINLGMLRNI